MTNESPAANTGRWRPFAVRSGITVAVLDVAWGVLPVWFPGPLFVADGIANSLTRIAP